MKKLLITLLFVGIGCFAWAYDFSVPRQGYSLYFNIVDNTDKAVELVAPQEKGNYRWMGIVPPTGVVNIPAEVEHDGVVYTVVSIAERAFSGCADVTGVNFPPTLTDIGAYAFYQCPNLRGVITLGENIINVGRGAFYGCMGITELRFNAVACESMGGSRSATVFGNCRSLTKVTFGPNVRFIPDYAFVGMDMLRFQWNLPESLEAIGEYAFAYCYSISGNLVIPEGVKVIGPYAFAQCHSTTGIEIPARIERIDQRAFYQCINVRQITVKAIVPPNAGVEIFSGVPAGAPLYVPCISVDSYRNAKEWGTRSNIRQTEPCTIELYARPDDPESGKVVGYGTYRVGDTATLTAICHLGYGFQGWADGNGDNPRQVIVKDTTTYVAVMKEAEVIREVEYIHDTTYMDGVEVIYETYEVNDVAEPISSQERIVYDRKKRRVDVPIDRKEIMSLALYNEAGQCIFTGKPLFGHVNMRRYPTGYYIIRITTLDDEQFLRFFHSKNK
ncbi:MAG: leucine-rich repeat domain-containing protein [Bacteroidales bacterium]|nr:leucine-rich repeat domain-containing protein [Bacteroidales bacterium]